MRCCLVVIGILAIAYTGVTASTSATALRAGSSVQAAAASGPLHAVKSLLASSGPCIAPSYSSAACPITSHLRHRLKAVREPFSPLCRCQAVPQKVSYQLYAYNDAHTIAYVITGWYYRGKLSYKITWQVVKSARRWLVEDSWCTGRHASTLYTSSISPCN